MANVVIKGTKRGTISNANGEFEFANVDEESIIIISAANIDTREFKVNGKTELGLLSVVTKITSMDEVVVNKGYYSESRRTLTGNVGKVTSKEIERQPVSNPLAALVGRVAGLDVMQESGLPGTGFTLRLRGVNSVRPGANDPLVIVDGIPYPSGAFNEVVPGADATSHSLLTLGYVSMSPLNSINPNDIESIEVLKDADATSIYGSRGGNGVILITTKKGRAGKSKISLNFSSGMAKMGSKVDVLDRRQYLDMRYEAIKNDGRTIETAPAHSTYDLRLWDTTRSTDWQEVLLGGTAQYTRAQVSLSGGNQNTSFVFNGNYSRETTIMPVDLANTRYNGRLAINHESANQRLKAQVSVNYGVDNNRLPASSIASFALTLPPIAPSLYDESGRLNWGPDGGIFQNPVARLKELYSGRIGSLVTNGMFSYELFKGFRLRTSVGYNQVQNNALTKRGQDFYNPTEWPTRGKFLRMTKNLNLVTNTWTAEPQFEYERTLGPGKLSMLAGVTFQESNTEGMLVEVTNYPDEALMGNPNFGEVNYIFGQKSKYNYNALFGRINYNMASKYIVNITVRRDGSSRFAPGKKFGNFGAAGVAWLFSEEPFVKNSMPFLSFGKLRGSYGTTGNDAIPEYGFLSLYGAEDRYAGALSLSPTGLFNNEYSWETNRKAEIGLDLSFFQNRISLSASYYNNRSSNQLVPFALPSIVGFTSVQSNLPATVQNTGLEIELNTINISKRDWNWSSSFNISFPRNKLVSYPNLEASPYASTYFEGHPLNIFRTYDFVRIDPNTGMNVFKSYRYGFDTANNSLLSVLFDAMIPINLGKDFFGGFNNSIRYKQFQLDIFFNFSRQVGPSTDASLFNAWGRIVNMPVDRYLRRWQQKGDITDVRGLSNDPASNPTQFSGVNALYNEAYYTTISMVRLKNISISYSLPGHLLKKTKIEGCRLYLQGQNLFTITNYKGWDPENQSSNYPLLKVMTAGVELNF